MIKYILHWFVYVLTAIFENNLIEDICLDYYDLIGGWCWETETCFKTSCIVIINICY